MFSKKTLQAAQLALVIFSASGIAPSTASAKDNILKDLRGFSLWVTDANPGWFCIGMAGKTEALDADALLSSPEAAVSLSINGIRVPLKSQGAPQLVHSSARQKLKSPYPDLRDGHYLDLEARDYFRARFCGDTPAELGQAQGDLWVSLQVGSSMDEARVKNTLFVNGPGQFPAGLKPGTWVRIHAPVHSVYNGADVDFDLQFSDSGYGVFAQVEGREVRLSPYFAMPGEFDGSRGKYFGVPGPVTRVGFRDLLRGKPALGPCAGNGLRDAEGLLVREERARLPGAILEAEGVLRAVERDTEVREGGAGNQLLLDLSSCRISLP